jgi:hypothetical protein
MSPGLVGIVVLISRDFFILFGQFHSILEHGFENQISSLTPFLLNFHPSNLRIAATSPRLTSRRFDWAIKGLLKVLGISQRSQNPVP